MQSRRTVAGIVTAVLALAAATLGPTMLAGAQSGNHLVVNVTGNGKVTDDAGKINCPSTCDAYYPVGTSTYVYLTEAPGTGDTFQGWSGPCQGTATKCGFYMDKDTQVGASFTGGGPSPTPSPSPTATPTPAPSATPTPAPSATPSPSPGATFTVTAPKVQSLAATAGTIRVFLRCPLGCKLVLRTIISVPLGAAKVFSLETVRRTLVAGKRTRVSLRLPRALRRAIRHHATRRHPARARVSVTGSGRTVRRTVSLIP